METSLSLSNFEMKDTEMVTFQDIIGIVPSSPGLYMDAILSTFMISNARVKNVTSLRNYNAFWVQTRTIKINGLSCEMLNPSVKEDFAF